LFDLARLARLACLGCLAHANWPRPPDLPGL